MSLFLGEWERQKGVVRFRMALEETERKDDDDDAFASLRNATWRKAARGLGMSIGEWARKGPASANPSPIWHYNHSRTGAEMRPLSVRSVPSLALLLVFLGGCMATPKVLRFGPSFGPKSPDAPVEVFQTRAPDRPYQEIASISVGDTDDEFCMEQILIKAREVGADAVILMGRVGTIGAATRSGRMAYAVDFGLSAIAIRYR